MFSESTKITDATATAVVNALGYEALGFEIPPVMRAELNADRDRDLLARMRYLASKKRMLEPDITDEEMADYLALAEDFPNFDRWLSARRGADDLALPAKAPWVAATAVIVGFLAALLLAAIAAAA
jgi:hypothetical protein